MRAKFDKASDAKAVTRVTMMRHGECEGGNIYRGTTDVSLSALGWQQMNQVVEAASTENSWDVIISSPLKRCREFAEAIQEKFSLPLVLEPRFREIDFGCWEGRLISEVWESDRDNVEKFYRDPEQASPGGGESMLDVKQRVMSAWQALTKQYDGKRILLIHHGGTIRILLSAILDMPLASMAKLAVPYAALSELEILTIDKESFAVVKSCNRYAPGAS